MFSALLLAFGHFGDRFGRKLALQLGLVVFALTSALAAMATTSTQLIGARALMGVGAAFVFPATLAILVNVFTDRKERAAAIGIWSACTGIAVALGPVTGGYLLEHFAWGSIFLVNLPLAALAIIAGWFLVPTSRDPNTGGMDHLGLVLSAAGVALVVWAIIEAPHRGWTDSLIMVGGAVGIGLLAAFVAWERRVPHPLLDVRLFRNARFSAASLSVAAAFFALFGFIFLITQYLQLVQGYSPLEAGLRTLPFAIATGVTSPLAIVAMHRWGSKLVVAGGLAVMSVGFVLASFVEVDTPYTGLTVISMVTIAIGLGLTTGPGDRVDHGRPARGEGRRGLRRQRHDARARRHPRRGRGRLGLRQRLRRRARRRPASPSACRVRCSTPPGSRRPQRCRSRSRCPVTSAPVS